MNPVFSNITKAEGVKCLCDLFIFTYSTPEGQIQRYVLVDNSMQVESESKNPDSMYLYF